MIEKFKQKMETMQVPKLQDDPLQKKLKKGLIHKYFGKENKYKRLFKIAVGFCLLFFLLTISFLADPRIPQRIHSFTFGTEASYKKNNELVDENEEALRYTSINNPKFEQNIVPEKYKEENAYLIRQYSSNDKEGVLVVSRFDNEEKDIKTNRIY